LLKQSQYSFRQPILEHLQPWPFGSIIDSFEDERFWVVVSYSDEVYSSNCWKRSPILLRRCSRSSSISFTKA
jgi:hypothetical protein